MQPQRGGGGIVPYPFATWHQKEVRNQHHAPTTFPAERPNNYRTVGWVRLEISLDDENLTPHWDLIPALSSIHAIPATFNIVE
jgi:hypothetical protein